MMHEFSRTEMLIGAEGLSRLAASTVVVFGIGGVGSHSIEALARCGIGSLVLIDHDTVSLTNLNRQSIASHSSIGKQKTQVMKEKLAGIHPRLQVFTIEQFILPDDLPALFETIQNELSPFGSISYILDAIDTVSTKLALASYAAKHQIPLICAMGTGNKVHPELFRISDIFETSVCPLCRVMRKELKALGIPSLKVCWSPEKPLVPKLLPEDTNGRRSTPGSISFVPPVAGLIMAGEIIRELCGL